MDWIERTAVLEPGIARSIQARAEDGHLIRADLVAPQTLEGAPTIMVTCDPVTFDDGVPQLERFPTFYELVEAADELGPRCVWNTIFPSYRPGEREPPPPGCRTIPLNWIGKVEPVGIQLVGALG